MDAKKGEPKKLSMASTKQEMMDAYNAVLKQLREKEESELKPEKKAEEKKVAEVIKTAEAVSAEGIATHIAGLKTEIGKMLSQVADKLEVEARAWAAKQTGKPARRVAYYVALFDLPAEVQALIGRGALDVGHGAALLRLSEVSGQWTERTALQVALARRAVAQGYSVERLAAVVSQHVGSKTQGAMFGDDDLGGKDKLLARANTRAVLDRVTEAVAEAIKRTWDDTQQHFRPDVLGKGELEAAVSRLRGARSTLAQIERLVEGALEAQEARGDLSGVGAEARAITAGGMAALVGQVAML